MSRRLSTFSKVPPIGSRSVLIAIDGSEHSKRAFDYYVNWLHRPDDSVTIYHAVEPVSLPTLSLSSPMGIPSSEWSNIVEANVKRVRELENDYSAECLRHNLIYQFLYESVEHIGASIIQQVEKYEVRLIVIGSRGLGAIKRTIMGSVSDYVVHHANTAVCVVPSIDEVECTS
uniref:Putative universal stress protein n=1 Tax=Schistosoma japonicum TaxID=6182 RepID=C1LPS1_SCHJA|nr:putative universal stress protein [Schistosoma japonicum]CAX76699.1 putative universal stress protein [Schistosoma japonicum]